MNAKENRDDTPDPTSKAPYQRPKLKRVGQLRDVTAGPPATLIDMASG